MALIDCFECRKTVSDSAVACPHCGFPIAKKRSQMQMDQAIGQVQYHAAKAVASAKRLSVYYVDLDAGKFKLLKERLVSTDGPISLRRINGIGLRFGSVQHLSVSGIPTKYAFGMLVFTIFFVPIIPLGFSIVEPTGGGYIFLGNVKFKDAHVVFGSGVAIKSILRAFLEGVCYIVMVLLVIFVLEKLFNRY